MRNSQQESSNSVLAHLQPLSGSERNRILLILSWLAGSVDAVSYVELGHVFTANMTGNTILLGLSIGEGQVAAELRSVAALIGFILGTASGAMMVRSQKQGEWSPTITAVIALEWLILGICAVIWYFTAPIGSEEILLALITLVALAMGIQTAAMYHLNIEQIVTTYITGTLTSLVTRFVNWLTSTAKLPSTSKQGAIGLQLLALVIYCSGAAITGFIASHWPAFIIALPLSVLSLIIVGALLLHRR